MTASKETGPDVRGDEGVRCVTGEGASTFGGVFSG
jgi:hypothetical protein